MNAADLTAQSYLKMLERLALKERIKCLEELMKCRLEDSVRPVLRREYLNLTERTKA